MTKLALFLQWAALVFALALTAQAAPAASQDKHPKHWQEGRGDQGWQWRWEVWLPDLFEYMSKTKRGPQGTHKPKEIPSP